MNNFSTKDITELNDSLNSGNKSLSIIDITDKLKTMSICIDKICLVPEGKDVVQYYNESTTGFYLTEWNKGPGKLLRIDMRDLLRNKFENNPYFKYFEIVLNDKKYLIRCIQLDTCPEGEFDKLESLSLIHGKFESYIYTIIKIININSSYAARPLINDSDFDGSDSYIEEATGSTAGIEDESEIKLECVQLFD